MVLLNVQGLQDDMDAMRACLLSRKGQQLSKKQREVFSRWLTRCEEALERASDRDRAETGAVERVQLES